MLLFFPLLLTLSSSSSILIRGSLSDSFSLLCMEYTVFLDLVPHQKSTTIKVTLAA